MSDDPTSTTTDQRREGPRHRNVSLPAALHDEIRRMFVETGEFSNVSQVVQHYMRLVVERRV